MARALIVGCGCSGRALGTELLEDGWAVRGTSRDAEGLEAIEAAGIEPARADPERPGTVLDLVGDVAIVLWLLGSAEGSEEDVAAIHGPRLESPARTPGRNPGAGLRLRGGGDGRPGVPRTAGRNWCGTRNGPGGSRSR